jgi:hypothetical protein
MKHAETKHFLGKLRQGFVISLYATFAGVGLFAADATAADCQGTLTKLSECRRDADSNVVVGSDDKCRSVYIDDSLDNYGRITVDANGAMCVRDRDLKGQTVHLYVQDILVKGQGRLQIGSKDAPIGSNNRANNVRIMFKGEAPNAPHDAHSMNDDQPCPDPNFKKGLQLCKDGVLQLFGSTGAAPENSQRAGGGKVSWTYLSQPAGDPCRFGPNSGAGSPVTNEGCSVWPGGRALNLADAVDWRVGDWVAIGTTSFSPFETEFNRIKQVNGTAIVLEYPLTYYHFGGPDPTKSDYRTAGRDLNWGVDERAEVGLISRNIELRGVQSGAPQDHWGGETIIREGFKEASIQGVEFAFMGKPNLGSYPAHFHRVGRIDTGPGKQTVLFNANSIHHSYNKCITVHSTQNLVLQNNVCARAVGHLFYQEVGDEEDITFQYNLGLGAMSHNFDIHEQREVIYNTKPITAITRDNPGKVTVAKHEYTTGDTVYISGVVGMTQVNGQSFTITRVDDNNFTLGVNTTGYSAYSSGGLVNVFLPVPNPQQRYQLVENYWWPGDHMARLYGIGENYFGLNVANHDNQLNPTHGSCRDPLPSGDLGGGREPTEGNLCKPSQYYEPASGFWIINPGTKLIGNSIGGCQGVGRAYWYVPPTGPGDTKNPDLKNLKFKPIGEFRNNRAHSCYAGLYVEPENTVFSEQLQPHLGGTPEGASVFNVVDGLTVTRMRDRGIWLRPSFWVVKNARLATNRDSVSLVTAGGVDGTAPGNWALLQDSLLLGISLNNVDRFGPCPYLGVTGPQSGGERGCIDQTPYDRGKVVADSGGDDVGRGYPQANRNFFGLMIYDGPGRYFGDRFVNFNRDISPYLTADDQAVLGWYKANNANPLAPDGLNIGGSFVYEGDAALGWFNANQSSYPNTQASEGLMFENVNLRHQIYTDRVGIDLFNDGDKNTLILDRDHSLTGMKVVGSDKKPLGNVFPASLNNLPYNASSNSVDECLSTGTQNTLLEGRPTSLISPSAMATLEFSSLFPQALQKEVNGKKEYRYEQILSFSKTSPDQYPDPVGKLYDRMLLHGRNGLGVWEPKVSNGYGYTVSAVSKYNAPNLPPAPPGQDVGIPDRFNVGLTDVIMQTDPATHKVVKPFHARLAICMTGRDGKHPQPKADIAKMFQVTRGYKAYGSATANEPTLVAKNVWREIKDCFNLDSQNPGNVAGCPAKTVAVDGQCPDGEAPVDGACPTKALAAAADIASWEKNENSWYYDKSSGYLYLHLLQKVDNGNPKGPLSSPSPTGSCDPAKVPLPAECPNANTASPENYYFCPAGGCIAYGVTLDPSQVTEPYVPSQSTCVGPPALAPADSNLLVDASTGAVLARDPKVGKPQLAKPGDAFPHYALKGGDEAKMCPNPGAATQPPWGPPKSPPELRSFQVNFVPTLKIYIEEMRRPGVTPAMFLANPGNLVVSSLEKGTAYTIKVSTADDTCTATFVPDGTRDKPTFKRQQGSGNCIPPDGGGTIFATPSH